MGNLVCVCNADKEFSTSPQFSGVDLRKIEQEIKGLECQVAFDVGIKCKESRGSVGDVDPYKAGQPGPYEREKVSAAPASRLDRLSVTTTPIVGLVLGNAIASGSFGTVYYGTFRGTPVAVKFMRCQPGAVEAAGMRAEAVLGFELRHPHLVKTITFNIRSPNSSDSSDSSTNKSSNTTSTCCTTSRTSSERTTSNMNTDRLGWSTIPSYLDDVRGSATALSSTKVATVRAQAPAIPRTACHNIQADASAAGRRMLFDQMDHVIVESRGNVQSVLEAVQASLEQAVVGGAAEIQPSSAMLTRTAPIVSSTACSCGCRSQARGYRGGVADSAWQAEGLIVCGPGAIYETQAQDQPADVQMAGAGASELARHTAACTCSYHQANQTCSTRYHDSHRTASCTTHNTLASTPLPVADNVIGNSCELFLLQRSDRQSAQAINPMYTCDSGMFQGMQAKPQHVSLQSVFELSADPTTATFGSLPVFCDGHTSDALCNINTDKDAIFSSGAPGDTWPCSTGTWQTMSMTDSSHIEVPLIDRDLGFLETSTRSTWHTCRELGQMPEDFVLSAVEGTAIPSVEVPAGNDELAIWIVQEYCDQGALQNALASGRFHDKDTGEPDMAAILHTALEIASALRYLHRASVVHSDLSASNIMLSSVECGDSNIRPVASDTRGFRAKVGDLGMCTLLSNGGSNISRATRRQHGTITHQPPEILTHSTVSRQTDCYSLGVLLWQLYTGKSPYKGLTHAQIIVEAISETPKLVFPASSPKAYADLARACISYDPRKRPSMTQICHELRAMLQQYCRKQGGSTPVDAKSASCTTNKPASQ